MTSKEETTSDLPDKQREEKVDRREGGRDRRDTDRVDVTNKPRRQKTETRAPLPQMSF
jgi:hypothetical protein